MLQIVAFIGHAYQPHVAKPCAVALLLSSIGKGHHVIKLVLES